MTDFSVLNTLFSIFIGLYIFEAIVRIIMIIVWWKIYKKAGQHGWESIIPLYNDIVLYDMVGINPLWAIGTFIISILVEAFEESKYEYATLLLAIALLIFTGYVYIRLAQAFGHSKAFGIGILFLPIIFLPIIAFGKSSTYNPKFKYEKDPGNDSDDVIRDMNQNVTNTVNDVNNVNTVNNINNANNNIKKEDDPIQNFDLSSYANKNTNENMEEKIDSDDLW